MDLHTLHVSSALTNITCGVVLAVAWCVREEKSYLGWWSVSFMLFAVGLLSQIEGSNHPAIGALTYTFLIAGTLLMLSGFRSFDERPAFSGLMLVSLPLPPIVYLALLKLLPGTDWPELATFVVSCLISVQIPFYVLTQNHDRLAFRWVAGSAFTVQLVFTVTVLLWGSALITPENVTLAISLSDQVCSTIVIACVLGMVIERDNHRLDRIAHQDALTGCLNRAGLLSYKEVATGPHGVLVADFDHFKQLNDQYGHAAGDEALRVFVRRADACLPQGAVLARSGGEEFVALLPGASTAEAERIAIGLGDAVRAGGLEFEGATIPFTISVGVAEVAAGEMIRAGIRRADAALYKAKRDGRDRVAVFEDAPPAKDALVTA
ncbi:GGDEF domain-containing protein [Aureimonas sp. AU40]|uniref:GGDEF domain-containing protein n=1 Tax=Aureimonas sp. AU40 TaxID=1637747 RepID=UPI000782AEC8|nr:GGDEF domain-containing protein [Aureimonas sp. AU40]